jgi:hypothetical protein
MQATMARHPDADADQLREALLSTVSPRPGWRAGSAGLAGVLWRRSVRAALGVRAGATRALGVTRSRRIRRRRISETPNGPPPARPYKTAAIRSGSAERSKAPSPCRSRRASRKACDQTRATALHGAWVEAGASWLLRVILGALGVSQNTSDLRRSRPARTALAPHGKCRRRAYRPARYSSTHILVLRQVPSEAFEA